MTNKSENYHDDSTAEDTSAFDELAARAGAAMRRPAPEHGVAEAVRRGQLRRVATTLAAGGLAIVVVAVGVAVLRDDGDAEPTSPVATTTVDDGGNSAARAALISVDQLGPGWTPEFPATSLDTWRATIAAQPECAEYIATVQPLEATVPGGLAGFNNLQNQIVAESVSIYPSKDAASSVMDSMQAPGFEDCVFATWDAANSVGFPGSDPTTTGFNLAPPAAHGDRQIAFGLETITGNDSRTRLYHDIWIQVGRSIIWINVSPDGLGSDNSAGLVDKVITAAIASLESALPAG